MTVFVLFGSAISPHHIGFVTMADARTGTVCVSVRPSRPTLDQIKARNNRRTALGHARDILQNECAVLFLTRLMVCSPAMNSMTWSAVTRPSVDRSTSW